MDTESPMMSTFGTVVDGGRGGPGLHTHTPVVLVDVLARTLFLPTGTEGTQVVTAPQLGQPGCSESSHRVPRGQQVSLFAQHTASSKGQQPTSLPLNCDAQQVCPASQRVCDQPVRVASHDCGKLVPAGHEAGSECAIAMALSKHKMRIGCAPCPAR